MERKKIRQKTITTVINKVKQKYFYLHLKKSKTNNIKIIIEREVRKMIVVKVICMILLMLYAFDKFLMGVSEEERVKNSDKIVNLIEMTVSIILIFVIYRF